MHTVSCNVCVHVCVFTLYTCVSGKTVHDCVRVCAVTMCTQCAHTMYTLCTLCAHCVCTAYMYVHVECVSRDTRRVYNDCVLHYLWCVVHWPVITRTDCPTLGLELYDVYTTLHYTILKLLHYVDSTLHYTPWCPVAIWHTYTSVTLHKTTTRRHYITLCVCVCVCACDVCAIL